MQSPVRDVPFGSGRTSDLSPAVIHDYLQPGLKMLLQELDQLGGDHAAAATEIAELLHQSEVSLAAAGFRKGCVFRSARPPMDAWHTRIGSSTLEPGAPPPPSGAAVPRLSF